ncbi:hypothetical protein BGZ93_001980 [Podila epicladia]|nr:hypothetical protein BGZ92_006212 [Podila epicladia]KAG0097783.1 hypothetical protein BGZ93_001980 [Podila epicladia]
MLASTTTVNAMPVDRLLSYYSHRIAPPQHDPSEDTPYQIHSTGRVQIKRLPTPFTAHTPNPHPDLAEWYRFREQQQKQHEKQILQQAQAQAQLRLQLQEQHRRPPLPDLEGHAILDDEDDDAGNELLDTEFDGLLRPDADDEIEDTIEGQHLVEEEEEEVELFEDEENHDDGVEDMEVDVDGHPLDPSGSDGHSRDISIFARLALL